MTLDEAIARESNPPDRRGCPTLVAGAVRLLTIVGAVVGLAAASRAAPSEGAAAWPPIRLVTVDAISATTLEQRVATSSDDASEGDRGRMNLGNSRLQLAPFGNGMVGIRWSGLKIPQGATITAARIQFTAADAQGGPCSITIQGQADDNASTFGGRRNQISRRPRTAASTSWSPGPWGAPGEAGSNESTPDLGAVIQEIVSRPGWSSGNALAVIITGSGSRIAWAYDGDAWAAALLHVEFSIAPPPEKPPTARLSVVQNASPPLTVTADGSRSTDTDFTPIASYRFDFGDGSAAVTTYPPTATAQHGYAAAGTYSVSLVVTDTGGNASVPATVTITVSATGAPNIAVYVGYYDSHHGSVNPRPDSWLGSPGIVFAGNPDGPTGGWDTSAIRVDNLGAGTLSGVVVTADIGSHHYDLWGARTIPAGWGLIVAQTGLENFDGSDTNPAGCVSCSPSDCLNRISSTIPVVHVTVGGRTTDYYDTGQVLNTHGVDAAGCPYTGTRHDESEAWRSIGQGTPRAVADSASLAESPLPAAASTPHAWLGPSYPSPNHGELWLKFGIPARGRVRLAVYDVSGRLVRMLVDETIEAGEYVEHADLGDAPAGTYYCSLRTPADALNRAFVVIR